MTGVPIPLRLEDHLSHLKGWLSRGCPEDELLAAYSACKSDDDRNRVRRAAYGVWLFLATFARS